jgi:hypothetical protein
VAFGCQKTFGSLYLGQLIKSSGFWLPKNIRFIISGPIDQIEWPFSMNGGKESPVEFSSLPKLQRDDFLLSKEESYEFLNLLELDCQETLIPKRWKTFW